MLLAIETATSTVGCSLFDVDTNEVIAELEVRQGRRHAETLVPAIEFLCRQAQRSLSIISAVAVDIGPGLFTGLRVGVATAKALAVAREVPVVGVDSLAALAVSVESRVAQSVVSVIDARRGELYAAQYRVDAWRPPECPIAVPEAVILPWVGAPDAVAASARTVEGALVIGDGAGRYPDAFAGLEQRRALPSAVAVARLGAAALLAGRGRDAADLELVYLRPPDAEINWVTR